MTDWSDLAVARHILQSFRTWAVVGASSNPGRASHNVMRLNRCPAIDGPSMLGPDDGD